MAITFTEEEQRKIEARAQALVRRQRLDNAVRARAREIETGHTNTVRADLDSLVLKLDPGSLKLEDCRDRKSVV